MTEGRDLMEKALFIRDSYGTEKAALFLETNGINRPLAVLALVGSLKAKRYGVTLGLRYREGL